MRSTEGRHVPRQAARNDGKPITIGDLWELIPGNGGSAGDPNAIFVTAGVKNEAHGLFGSLTPNQMPTPAAMTGTSPASFIRLNTPFSG